MRIWLKRILITLASIASLLLALVGPIDRTPLAEQPFYQRMHAQLASLTFEKSEVKSILNAGWKKITITPENISPEKSGLLFIKNVV